MKRSYQQRGFTLVELMVTLVIIGVLSVSAIVLSPKKYNKGAKGFVEQIGAMMVTARDRAIATGRQQMVDIGTTQIRHWQADWVGFGTATTPTYTQVQILAIPSAVSVSGAATGAGHPKVSQGGPFPTGTPDPPTTLPADRPGTGALTFFPDGTAQPATIFALSGPQQARLCVYRLGNIVALDNW